MSDFSLQLYRVSGIPLIRPGDQVASIIFSAIQESDFEILDGDIFVIAQKIVSKAEGRIVDLGTVSPGPEAIELGTRADKDPRQAELILQESNEIVRCKEGVIITEHNSGIVMANAGIDHSNVSDETESELVTLLPEDSNRSAHLINEELSLLFNKQLGTIINDSVGRAWRVGTVGLALGSANILPLRDLRGETDLFGKELRVSETADADSLASAAELIDGRSRGCLTRNSDTRTRSCRNG